MPAFRWPKVENDLALCMEVIQLRPGKAENWDAVAASLTSAFNLTEPLKGRGCREHLELLVKKYKSEDNKALKR